MYGKRKADAPRAVFEQKSSPKDVEKNVVSLEIKMAGISLGTGKGARMRVEKKDIEETVNHEDEDKGVEDDLEPPKPEPDTTDSEEGKNVEEHVDQSPVEDTPIEAKRQTMVGVHISPRKPTLESDGHQSEEHHPEEQAATFTSRRRRTAATATRKKLAARLSSGCVQDEKANEYTRPILNEALSPIAAQGVQKFGSWAARGGNMLEVVKIAEGSYGEVYKMRVREEVCKQEMSKSKLARLMAYGEGVFKVVPLRAAKGAGSKKFTSVEEIVSEVKMLKYLDPIPGFARFRDIHVVQGRFPESFQDAWDHYKKVKPDDCLNPNPANKRAYLDTQMWAIIEMDDAGSELEKFSWSSMFQIYDIFWGVAMALARAEEYALFEHRDLHLGNVCIRTTRPDGSMSPPTDLEVVSRSQSSGYGLSTLETTIIDYSLSRAELRFSEDLNVPVEVASSDLDKKQIFDATGQDEDEALLRDTYRQ